MERDSPIPTAPVLWARRALRVVVAVALLILMLTLAGCGTSKTLPTTLFSGACRGIGLDATVVGSLEDPRSAWLITDAGVRKDLVWPSGYVARFNPGLEVLDETGAVVFRQGDLVRGACLRGPADDPGAVLQIKREDRVNSGS